ncbi:hypothetical protein NQ315_004087 [Exocentrus adspersus]|uniref:Homeobox domain-containing protein n=1 Tax=Exocentrus adspersus TaxID=1586481 RepID=A0AAV8W758_9CUCU|nr:hypothetical protein NQ315_004087 [Exocentrus adspersus]
MRPNPLRDLNSDYLDMSFGRSPGTPGLHGSSQRTKRMRTSFKHHQLRTMKSYFAINHNPDAKDLKQLSQKTGLPKRVLQLQITGVFVSLKYRSPGLAGVLNEDLRQTTSAE